MPITIDLSTVLNAKNKLTIVALKSAASNEWYKSTFDGVFGSRWSKFSESKPSKGKSSFGGLECDVYLNGELTGGDVPKFADYLDHAMACLVKCPDVKLADYKISIIFDAKPGSAGYVYKESLLDAKPCIAVFLGNDLWSRSAPNLRTELVGNYLHKIIKASDDTRFANRAMACIFHEFGHVFHQLLHQSHYVCLGVLPLISGKAESEFFYGKQPVPKTTKNPFKKKEVALENDRQMKAFEASCAFVDRLRSQWDLFPNFPQIGYLKDFHDGVSKYIGTNLGSYASQREPEVVAEVFAALMMGVGVPDGVKTIYEQFGGYVPGDDMRFDTDCSVDLPELIQHFRKA